MLVTACAAVSWFHNRVCRGAQDRTAKVLSSCRTHLHRIAAARRLLLVAEVMRKKHRGTRVKSRARTTTHYHSVIRHYT